MLSAVCGRKMKAQAMVFERMMLFLIGVIIFVVCFAIFMGYQDYFTTTSMDSQMDILGSHISYSILKVAEKEYEAESRLNIEIPKRIGNEPYIVILSSRGLNITTTITGENRFFNVYGLNESFTLGGEKIVSTATESVMIYKKGNRIILI